MILNDAEREKFAAYLEQDAASNEAILRQMEKLPHYMEGLAKAKRAEIAAERIVARMLRQTSSETIG